MKVVVNIHLLNIRSEANMESKVLRVAKAGERFEVVSNTDDWFCVHADVAGTLGFVVAKYVRVDE